MKWFNIFKQYQIRKLTESKFSYFIIIISLIMSTTIAMAIPQINQSTIQYANENAKLINGADLKVETDSAVSKKFEDKIEELKKNNINISLNNVYQQVIKSKSNNILFNLISCDYVSDDNVIIYKNLADQLGLNINDKITILGKEYNISKIDQEAYGVNRSSEQIGYCKISDKNITNSNYLTNKIYLINTGNSQEIKNELSEIESNYYYTTIDDQKENLLNKLNTSLMALGMLNTMCIVLTIISVASSIFLIINNRKKDISVMKCLSIYSKDIKRSLRFELKLIFALPILIGAYLSKLVAGYLLSNQNIPAINSSDLIVKGFVFFIVVYFLFINLATLNIKDINPLAFFRDNQESKFNLSKIKIIVFSVLYVVLIMFIYSVFYLQNSVMIASAIIVILASLLFYGFVKLLLYLFLLLKTKKPLNNYTINSLFKNSSSYSLFTMSSALLAFLILFGFTFEKTMGDSYSKNLESHLEYNYVMISSDNKDETFEKLNKNKSIEKYSLINIIDGIANSNQMSMEINLGNLESKDNNINFEIIEGKSLEECMDNEIIVSKIFIENNRINLYDKLFLNLGNDLYSEYKIVGIYDSGSINNNLLLRNSNNDFGREMYLIKSNDETFFDSFENASIINISFVGNILQKQISEFLVYFKILCFICVISSLFFNFNMMYMRCFEDIDVIIGQAIGRSKSFYFRSSIIKNLILFILSSILSILLYIIIVTKLLNSLNMTLILSFEMFIVPLICIIILNLCYYLLEVYFIKRFSNDYEILRER